MEEILFCEKTYCPLKLRPMLNFAFHSVNARAILKSNIHRLSYKAEQHIKFPSSSCVYGLLQCGMIDNQITGRLQIW